MVSPWRSIPDARRAILAGLLRLDRKSPWILRQVLYVLVGFACWSGIMPSFEPRRSETLANTSWGVLGLSLLVLCLSMSALTAGLASLSPDTWAAMPFSFATKVQLLIAVLLWMARSRGMRFFAVMHE